ncbi:MAG: hypothetical protein AAF621_04145, partial [Pseudomonadota bacterium]
YTRHIDTVDYTAICTLKGPGTVFFCEDNKNTGYSAPQDTLSLYKGNLEKHKKGWTVINYNGSNYFIKNKKTGEKEYFHEKLIGTLHAQPQLRGVPKFYSPHNREVLIFDIASEKNDT